MPKLDLDPPKTYHAISWMGMEIHGADLSGSRVSWNYSPAGCRKEIIMKRCVMLLAISAIWFGLVSQATARDLAEIEKELSALWTKSSTYSAKLEMKGHASQGGATVQMDGKGAIEGMKKDSTTLYRMEMDQTISMGETKMPNKMLVVYDGTQVFTQTSMMGPTMVFKSKPEEQSQMVPGGGPDAFKQMHAQFNITVLPDDTINGEPVYVLELRPKEDTGQQPSAPGKSPQFEKALLSLSQKTGLPFKMLMFNDGDMPLMTIVYKDYKIGAEIDAARFSYTPPPGAMVMDADTLRQMSGTP